MPVDEADLLVELDQFVSSVDRRNLKVVVRELGLMFSDTGRRAPADAGPGQQVHRRGGRPRGGDDRPPRQRADRPADPARRGREHPLVRARPAAAHRFAAPQRRRPARCPAGHPGHGPGDRGDAGRPRAHPAGAARQRRQHQPGGGLAPRRARAAPGHLPAHHLQRLHRDPAHGRRPGEHAVLQQGAALHRGLHAAEPVAAGRPDHRRPDLPGPLRERPAVQHAGRQVRARQRRAARHRVARTVVPTIPPPAWWPAPWMRRGTPSGSSIRATCRSWETIRGSGFWWVRWRAGEGRHAPSRVATSPSTSRPCCSPACASWVG